MLSSSESNCQIFTHLPPGIFSPAAVEYLVETIGMIEDRQELKMCLCHRQVQLKGLEREDKVRIYEASGRIFDEWGNYDRSKWVVLYFKVMRIDTDYCRVKYKEEGQEGVDKVFSSISMDG